MKKTLTDLAFSTAAALAAVTIIALTSYLAFSQSDTIVIKEIPKGNDFWNSILGVDISHGTFAALLFFGFVGVR